MKIEYRPGKDNPSDYISSHPLKIDLDARNLAEEYVAFTCEESVPNAMTIDEIKMRQSLTKRYKRPLNTRKLANGMN